MEKLLHIIATPREEESRTLRVTASFLEPFRSSHPDWVIEELDLFKETLPSLTMKRVDGKYVLLGGKDLYGELKEAWQEIIAHIERFMSADAYLISTPMWNFSIPYLLKQYIDIIVQPKFLFRYTEKGVEGLAKNRKMIVITSRGGEYATPETKNADLQEPYLRLIFGFVGITDITFIIAQPMDMGAEVQEAKIRQAQEKAEKLARSF
ncbi:MAG: NAD(P)H-dependent oxidoreductase [Candidatus Aureabacteria bacterium]|nr:NAD(P)H-dependent oxidoreductase [Candidatus Auribacterota bacterium]